MEGPWYGEGLRFGCTGCGGCCRGAPGYVWLSRREAGGIARHFGLETARFRRECLKSVRGRLSLRERANGDCIFFREGQGCMVYPVRPRQCRTFPFWPENLKDAAAWEALRPGCPGIGEDRLFPSEEIRRIRMGRGEASEHP